MRASVTLPAPGGDYRGRLHGGVGPPGQERQQPRQGDLAHVPQHPPGTVQHSTAQHSTVQYSTVQYISILQAVTTFRIKHKPDTSLRIRIGLHTGTDTRYRYHRTVAVDIQIDNTLHPRSVLRGRGGSEDAALLPVRRHGQHGLEDGEQRPASQDPLQRGHARRPPGLQLIPAGVQGRDGGQGEAQDEDLLAARREQ